MITVNKIITLNPSVDSTGPYTWTLSASNTPVSGCVTFSQTTGVIVNPASETINVDINFTNQTCLDESTITLTVTYNGGECSTVIELTIEDPCSDLVVGAITHQAPYTFSVAPTGGTPNYNYTWVYNTSDFNVVGQNNNNNNGNLTNTNVLQLEYVGAGTPPQTTNIKVIVTDQAGCSEMVSQNFILCAPSVPNFLVTLNCRTTLDDPAETICIIPTGCTGVPLDLTTFQFTVTTPGLTVTPFSDSVIACEGAGGRRFTITSDADVTPVGTYTITYTVQDVNGITSNTGTITVTVVNCDSENGSGSIVTQSPLSFTIPCSAIVTDIYEIGPMTGYVTSTNPIDWSTFDLIDPATGTGYGLGTLTTGAGADVDFNPSTLKIEYEIPAVTGADSFQWTVCDDTGQCAIAGTINIVLDCSLEPTAVNDSECGVCGEVIEHDVLANDTLNGAFNQLQVFTAPTNGVAAFNNDFASPQILYTANAGYSGSDSYVYRVRNSFGETDTATVTVTVICAGEDSGLAVCE